MVSAVAAFRRSGDDGRLVGDLAADDPDALYERHAVRVVAGWIGVGGPQVRTARLAVSLCA
ncbi:hypothetical protein [Salinispora arenicola]|uniref:hypothetical protein n=1 Tax=Salinispora arenicola TaxID=168697 RepID=UPI000370AE7E|nr:hypothetical protein [Salinispora arenicola]